ncbi:glutathione S-transferase U10-like [Quercus robur]|uniref:glutathione S-transferase U10-like n=1 Tax=Quercus robur TaxID=38942 RepID=UPI002163C20A|nr:glutathione S-transferase U10-like [Quercus robur]
MEEKQGEVVLFGTWASNPCTRVELALKLKGIPYEYVEEDLKNKSELLLRHNPVYKKVPVLVHNGKSIAESLIILEYIEECWNTTPKLLPEDPHQRAKVRFWANYYDQKVVPIFYIIFGAKGKEEREKAIEDLSQLLKVFEEGIEKDFPGQNPFFNGESLGYLGISIGSHGCNYKAGDEAMDVVLLSEKNPKFLSWVNALKNCPLMEETLPPHDKVVAMLRVWLNSTQA